MKLLHRLLIIFLTVLMFNSLEFSKADELDDFASEMNDIREEINDIRAEISNLKTENLEEIIQLDKSFQELDKIITTLNQRISLYFTPPALRPDFGKTRGGKAFDFFPR